MHIIGPDNTTETAGAEQAHSALGPQFEGAGLGPIFGDNAGLGGHVGRVDARQRGQVQIGFQPHALTGRRDTE